MKEAFQPKDAQSDREGDPTYLTVITCYEECIFGDW